MVSVLGEWAPGVLVHEVRQLPTAVHMLYLLRCAITPGLAYMVRLSLHNRDTIVHVFDLCCTLHLQSAIVPLSNVFHNVPECLGSFTHACNVAY